jgi:hypothetical protein
MYYADSKPRTQIAMAMAMAFHDGGGGRQDMMDSWARQIWSDVRNSNYQYKIVRNAQWTA